MAMAAGKDPSVQHRFLVFAFLGRHVLIAMSLLYCCPLVIYFDVSYEMPSFKPKLEYWPSDSWPVVVPYVTLEEPHKQC